MFDLTHIRTLVSTAPRGTSLEDTRAHVARAIEAAALLHYPGIVFALTDANEMDTNDFAIGADVVRDHWEFIADELVASGFVVRWNDNNTEAFCSWR